MTTFVGTTFVGRGWQLLLDYYAGWIERAGVSQSNGHIIIEMLLFQQSISSFFSYTSFPLSSESGKESVPVTPSVASA